MEKFEMYTDIQALLKQGYSKTRTAEKLGISRTTLYRYLSRTPKEMSDWIESTASRKKKLDVHKDLILEWLRKYPDLTAAQIHDWLKERFSDINIGESTVRMYVTSLRTEYDIKKERTIRDYEGIPDTPMGQQIQVDFGFKYVKNGYNKPIKLMFIAFVLANSRHKYAEFRDKHFTTKDVIDAHYNAFKYFQGVSKEIVYDQDRLMIVSENAGDLLLTDEFKSFVKTVGFEVRLCRKADPESKGKIENVVGYIKHNFMEHRIFNNIDTWNEQCLRWLERTANYKINNTTKRRPVEVFLLEKQHLKPVNLIKTSTTNSISRSVRKDNTINYLSNRYSVPLGTYNKYQEVLVVIDELSKTISILSPTDKERIATHQISDERGKLIKNRSHGRDRTKGIQEFIEVVKNRFSYPEMAENFFQKQKEIYPRYMRDQLTIISICLNNFSQQINDNALEICVSRELYSANDFKDVVQLLGRQRQGDSTNANADLIETIDDSILSYTKTIETEQRSLEKYVSIMGVNND